MWTIISESTLPPATEMALHPKNSRRMRGDFQIRKYILLQTAIAKSDFCDHEAATPLFIEIADTHIPIPYVRGKMATMSSDGGVGF